MGLMIRCMSFTKALRKGKIMENPNSEKKMEDIKSTETVETNSPLEAPPKPPRTVRYGSAGAGTVLLKEKIVIITAMASFALMLLGIVLAITFCGKEDTGLTNHTHKYDIKLEKIGDTFYITGECTAANCDNPGYTEIDPKDVTVTEERKATCKAGGQLVYSVERFGMKLTKTVYTEKENHKLGGVDVKTLMDDNGALIYDSDNKQMSLTRPADMCGQILEGSYTCSACEDKVFVKKMLIPHDSDGTWSIVVGSEPTCTENGIEAEYCKYCDKMMNQRNVPATGHNFRYSLTVEGDKVSLVKTCANVGCYDKEITDVTSEAKIVEETEPTCSKAGAVVYGYSKGGIEVTAKVETAPALGNHILNGTDYRELMDENGNIDFTIPGVKPFSGGTQGCGSVIDAYFVCANCKELKDIKAVLPSHSYELEEVIKEPTLAESGEAKLVCQNSFCNKDSELTVTLGKIVIGENAEIVEEASDIHGGVVKYTYTTELGVVITLDITLPLEL